MDHQLQPSQLSKSGVGRVPRNRGTTRTFFRMVARIGVKLAVFRGAILLRTVVWFCVMHASRVMKLLKVARARTGTRRSSTFLSRSIAVTLASAGLAKDAVPAVQLPATRAIMSSTPEQ